MHPREQLYLFLRAELDGPTTFMYKSEGVFVLRNPLNYKPRNLANGIFHDRRNFFGRGVALRFISKHRL